MVYFCPRCVADPVYFHCPSTNILNAKIDFICMATMQRFRVPPCFPHLVVRGTLSLWRLYLATWTVYLQASCGLIIIIINWLCRWLLIDPLSGGRGSAYPSPMLGRQILIMSWWPSVRPALDVRQYDSVAMKPNFRHGWKLSSNFCHLQISLHAWIMHQLPTRSLNCKGRWSCPDDPYRTYCSVT